MYKLTNRQNEILQLIQNNIQANGVPPTRAEIAKAMGFRSPNAAEDHLQALARKKIIELLPGTSRGIKLLINNLTVPVIGQITPIEISYTLDRSLFHLPISYLLQIQDDSFKKLAILKNDLLAVHQDNLIKPKPDQLILTKINNQLIITPYPNIEGIIGGVVVGMIRSLQEIL